MLSRSFYEDGINSAIASRMVEAKPQSAVDVALVGSAGPGRRRAALRLGRPRRHRPGRAVADRRARPVRGHRDLRGAGRRRHDAVRRGQRRARTVTFTVGEDGVPGFPWRRGCSPRCALLLVARAGRRPCSCCGDGTTRRRRPRCCCVVALAAIGGTDRQTGVRRLRGRPERRACRSTAWTSRTRSTAACEGSRAPGGDPAGIMPRLKDKNTPKVTHRPDHRAVRARSRRRRAQAGKGSLHRHLESRPPPNRTTTAWPAIPARRSTTS